VSAAPKHFFDPSRPRISNLPAFVSEGAGLSIIPGLYCCPRENGKIEISGFFSSGPNRSSRREITLPATDFAAFWSRWLADPEGVAEREFGWTPIKTTPDKKPAATLDLNDLLGDF
jgi:hypothetical protein